MKKGGLGGANTQTGIVFEGKVDLLKRLAQLKGYTIKGKDICYDEVKVAMYFKKDHCIDT